MPGRYVRAPEDPAYYDAIAAGDNANLKGVMSGVESIGAGLLTGYAVDQDQKRQQAEAAEKRRQVKALVAAFMAEGIPQRQAEIFALEYVKKGTQELQQAYNDRQKLAAEIKAKTATTEATQFGTEAARQKLPGEIAQQGATLEGTQAGTAATEMTTSLAPRETGARETTAAASMMGRETDASLAAHRIDQETLDWAKKFDEDMSGTIDPEEKKNMASAAYTSVLKQVHAAKMMDSWTLSKNDEAKRMAALTQDGIRQEAMRLTEEKIEAYEFGRDYSRGGDTGGQDGQDDNPAITSYEQGLQLINERVTDPAEKAKRIAKLKEHFEVQ